jgi:hypothetical protein
MKMDEKNIEWGLRAILYLRMGLHTEWAPLEEFPYSANAGHTG